MSDQNPVNPDPRLLDADGSGNVLPGMPGQLNPGQIPVNIDFTQLQKQRITELEAEVERLRWLVQTIKAHEERLVDNHIRVYMSGQPYPAQREKMLGDRYYYGLIVESEARQALNQKGESHE